VRFENCLVIDAGSIVSFSGMPGEGADAVVEIEASTLRGADAAIRIAGAAAGRRPGGIEVRANDSVFAVSTALFVFAGDADEALLEHVTWKGLGALIPPDVAVARRLTPHGPVEMPAAGRVQVEGVVPAKLAFRSDPDAARPLGSVLVDAGGAPSVSGRLPGVEGTRLPSFQHSAISGQVEKGKADR
jgi:hypothetical protein